MPTRFHGPPYTVPGSSATIPKHQPPSEPETDNETEPVSGASRRLRALAALSGSLTDSLSPEDAVALVEKKAFSALGATSAVVVTLGNFPIATSGSTQPAAVPGPAKLSVVHAMGLPLEIDASLEQMPLDAAVPLAEVARTGRPVFLGSEAELRRYPEWGEATIAAGVRGFAGVPVWANGELRGVLGVTWTSPRSFDEDERAFVLTLGVMCAQAILRAHLRAAELQGREQAERANRSKTQFLTMISHELRTPMNAVLGYTEIVADETVGPINALQKDHLGRVTTSGRHLLGLIEELLTYARSDAGVDAVNVETIQLEDLVEQSLVLVRPAAEKKGLRIRVEGPGQPVELRTDARKVRQIVVNLVANAVKFTDAGDIVVVLQIKGIEADVKVFIEVTDTGRGITATDQAHIFDAYWQEDSVLTRASGGTGLGLPLARQLAHLLGGDVIVARSEVGFGSTFLVTLPARYVSAANRAAASA
jgi:signal transduction histidine kinase